MVPDTQFVFYPGRRTLHFLFIIRHSKHAAKELKPQQLPRLHTAFIDFSQAYDTVPHCNFGTICYALPCLHHFSGRYKNAPK
eukprot:1141192-Pelagomonas_calceolata.AAC.1